jgi:hypothetical protein
MSVSLVYVGIIVGTIALVLGITLLGMRIVRWRRDVALRRHGVPFLVMPLSTSAAAPERPAPSREVTPPYVPVGRPVAVVDAPTADGGRDVRRPAPDEAGTGAARLDGTRLPDERDDTVNTGPFRPGEVQPGLPSAHLVQGSQVRFFRAEEGTLEFLPGRLEIVGGEDVGQEIHFARQVGETTATLTFGRSDGPPLRHVQLLDPTVSRQHARMTWDGNRWRPDRDGRRGVCLSFPMIESPLRPSRNRIRPRLTPR